MVRDESGSTLMEQARSEATSPFATRGPSPPPPHVFQGQFQAGKSSQTPLKAHVRQPSQDEIAYQKLLAIQEMMESNPVGVYAALKDLIFDEAHTKRKGFHSYLQREIADYSFKEGDGLENFAKYIKREAVDRKFHTEEDMSSDVSPYLNRVPIAETYQSLLGYKTISQAKSTLRSQGQKQTL